MALDPRPRRDPLSRETSGAAPPPALRVALGIPQTTQTLRQLELRRSISPASQTERPGASAARQKVCEFGPGNLSSPVIGPALCAEPKTDHLDCAAVWVGGGGVRPDLTSNPSGGLGQNYFQPR